MIVIVDTSALLALFDRNEPAHHAVTDVILASDDRLIVSPYVVAELDYLMMTRHGTAAEMAVLAELTGGAWELAQFGGEQLNSAAAIIQKYADQRIGVTDASIVVLAQESGTATIATLDRRHFSVIRFADGSAPQIVP